MKADMEDPGGFLDNSAGFDTPTAGGFGATGGAGEGGVVNSWRIKHPVVTFFHLLFRTLAIIAYLLCGWFSEGFIGSFVAIILLLSLDFWTVKNITGRIMAGLRWWNYVNEEGSSVWVFEKGGDEVDMRLSKAEVQIFWTGLVVSPVIWAFLFFTALFQLELRWVVLVIIGLILTGSNLLGYLRCRLGSSMAGAANAYVQQRVLQNITGIFKSRPSNSPSTQNLPV